MVARAYTSSNGYRYGYGTQEKDDDIIQGLYTAEYWEYDTRLGRRWNVDPMFRKYPWQSPYATFNNNPIYFSDVSGLEGDQPKEHKVKAGETLGKLAKMNGVTVDAIKDANSTLYGGKVDWNKRGANHDIIRTGETLNIPVKPKETPPTPKAMPSKNTSTPKPHLPGITTQELSVFKQIVKFGHDLDRRMEGNDDGANQGGYMGGQDGWDNKGGKQLFFGTIGFVAAPFTIAGGVTALAAGSAIEGTVYIAAGSVSMLNGADDMLSRRITRTAKDANGNVLTTAQVESFTQSLVSDPNWSKNIGTIKVGATFITTMVGGYQIWEMGAAKTFNSIDGGATLVGVANDANSLRVFFQQ